MKKLIEDTFPTASNCLETLTSEVFGIEDLKDKCCQIQHDLNKSFHFKVLNPNKREIHFLAIDHCLFSDENNLKKCDCAVFDERTFCFIEIKDSFLHSQRQRAKEQLISTIDEFKSKMNFEKKRIEAYLRVGETNPRPAAKATDIQEIIKFEKRNVVLFKGNEKKFS